MWWSRTPSWKQVRTHLGWFEDLWAKAEVQIAEVVAELTILQQAAKEAKKVPSRSPSVQRQASYSSISSVPEGAVIGEDAPGLVPTVANTAAAVPVSSSPLGSPGRAAPQSLAGAPVKSSQRELPLSCRWEGAAFRAFHVRLSTAALVKQMRQHWRHVKALHIGSAVWVQRGASVSDMLLPMCIEEVELLY